MAEIMIKNKGSKIMQVSIIIVSYNTKDLTLNCIKSIYQHTKNIEFEIIVVDNASSDGSIQAIEEQFPQVILIEAGDNIGFGRANNLGAKSATGEFLFLLNSDTLLIENSLKKLMDCFLTYSQKEKIGVLGAILIDENSNVINTAGHFPRVWKFIANYTGLLVGINFENSTYKLISFQDSITEVDMISGADMFLTRETFNIVKGFDEKFFLYYEETDLQKRLHLNGYKNFITNTTKIIHLEGGSSRMNNWKRIIIQESQNYYFRKNDKLWFPVYVIFQFPYMVKKLSERNYTLKERIEFCRNNLRSLI